MGGGGGGGDDRPEIRSVAIVGAGPAGAITAAALKAENYFERITVYERRDTAGGAWNYDADPGPVPAVQPGKEPAEIDPPLEIPAGLPAVIRPRSRQERFEQTAVYPSLTANVPDVAMCFSDARFAYGPFPPYYVLRQYIENYFSTHRLDGNLVLRTTVEDVARMPVPGSGSGSGPGSGSGSASGSGRRPPQRWKLTLRRYDPVRDADIWWEEVYDAVVLANGHYSVPYTPAVDGLEAFSDRYPGRVSHSKYYRSPHRYEGKRVVVVGNSASGHDLAQELRRVVRRPLYQSIRTASAGAGAGAATEIELKPVITRYDADTGRISFADGTHVDEVEAVIYCTGYRPSFPFWRDAARPLWDAAARRLRANYWHTFLRDLPTLAVVGLPRTLTWRSFEYQAVAVARVFSGRAARPPPPPAEQRRWERDRARNARRRGRPFHDIPWDEADARYRGGTVAYLDGLAAMAGLPTLAGDGRLPPALSRDIVWALENIRKGADDDAVDADADDADDDDWVVVPRRQLDCV